MLEERRQFPRLVPSTPLFVSMDDAKSGLLLDLCEGGLAVASLVPRNLDDVVSLTFDLPEGVGHIEAKAQVAWTRDSGHLTGVRFMDLDEVSQQQLSEWIAAGTNLRPAGSEEMDEPVIVTRSTYAQVDAIRRELRPDMWRHMRPEMPADMLTPAPMETPPQAEMQATEARVEEPVAPEMAMETVAEPEPVEAVEKAEPAMETSGTLFPEPTAEEKTFTSDAEMTDGELEEPAEAFAIAEMADDDCVSEDVTMTESEPKRVADLESAAPGMITRAEWVEHVAQMGDVHADTHLDADAHALPPDAVTVGWASDAVGWVTEITEKRVTAPEEAEFDGMFAPEVAMAAKAARPARSRHTIELVLAVVLLTWALVFLGYQMGSTGANRTAHDLTVPKVGGSGAAATASGTKNDSGKVSSSSNASFASAEAFREISPVPPVSSGRSLSASNSAAFETPAPAGRSMAVAPKPAVSAPAPREMAAPPAAGTTVLAGTAPAMNSGLVLQVGAMKMEGNATALMQDLKKKKFSAFVYRHGNDNLYRVGVGPFGDRDSSAKVKAELQKNGYSAITSKWVRDKG